RGGGPNFAGGQRGGGRRGGGPNFAGGQRGGGRRGGGPNFAGGQRGGGRDFNGQRFDGCGGGRWAFVLLSCLDGRLLNAWRRGDPGYNRRWARRRCRACGGR
ncbi:hypothetical protein, partial [Dactylosporangium sp. NPDC051541]|uniref:hypothetical protein n=1 Tax=Dactylosporangium sp. NPDC051541 TaxID=3363977 RepID=UPI0037A68823